MPASCPTTHPPWLPSPGSAAAAAVPRLLPLHCIGLSKLASSPQPRPPVGCRGPTSLPKAVVSPPLGCQLPVGRALGLLPPPPRQCLLLFGVVVGGTLQTAAAEGARRLRAEALAGQKFPAVTGSTSGSEIGFSALFMHFYCERVLYQQEGLSKLSQRVLVCALVGLALPPSLSTSLSGLRKRSYALPGSEAKGAVAGWWLPSCLECGADERFSAQQVHTRSSRGARMGRVDGLGLEVGLASLRADCSVPPGSCREWPQGSRWLGCLAPGGAPKVPSLPGAVVGGSPAGSHPGLLDGAVTGMRSGSWRPEPGPCSPRMAAFQG